MGRGNHEEPEETLELPLKLAPTPEFSFSGLQWNLEWVRIRARLAHEERALWLGIHSSGFGLYLTLDAAHDMETTFLDPLCGADSLHSLCPGPLPCLHHRLYAALLLAGDDALQTKLHELNTLPVNISSIGSYALEATDQLGYRARLARLDRDLYFVDVLDTEGIPAISCLIDADVCLNHTVHWKGAGCIGRLLTRSWPTPQLTALLETAREYEALVEGLTLPTDPHSRARSIFALDTPAGTAAAPLLALASTREQLILHAKDGTLPTELLDLPTAHCLLCRVGLGPGAPLPCPRHPGLSRLHASLSDTASR